MISDLLKDIDKTYGRFGRTDIVVWQCGACLPATSGAVEHIVLCVGISQAYFSFKIPVSGQNPAIAIYGTYTDEPSLVALVYRCCEIGSEKRCLESDSGDVVYSTKKVRSEKVSGKGFAQPVSCFRLDYHMPPLAVPGKFPVVELCRDIKGPFRRKCCLHCEVWIEETIGKQIGLKSNLCF